MKHRVWTVLVGAALLFGSAPQPMPAAPAAPGRLATLGEARKEHKTVLVRKEKTNDPLVAPPDRFRLVRYSSPAGKLAAYVSKPPKPGGKYPAIVWIFGGFDNSIGPTAWEPARPANDQSARAFWENGIVTMYPAFRGGGGNPGHREILYGEVEDVIAAAKFLAAQPEVDPKRIYLGGHSTGGTLALLAAESTNLFRAVFSFGPVSDVRHYGLEEMTFNTQSQREILVRSPIFWLHGIGKPTYVFEGDRPTSNIDEAQALARASKNPKVRCYGVPGHDHFSILAGITPQIAAQIRADTGQQPRFDFSANTYRPLP